MQIACARLLCRSQASLAVVALDMRIWLTFVEKCAHSIFPIDALITLSYSRNWKRRKVFKKKQS